MDAAASLLPRPPQRLVVLACEVLKLEAETFAKDYPHIVAVEILEMNLHEKPALLKDTLGKKISEVEARHRPDAVALVYGLCGKGLVGVRAQTCPLVVARAHDCVTLFLGSKERYLQMQKEQPETYWYTPGWNRTERAPSPEKFARLRREFTQKFDEEEVEYLLEEEMRALQTYKAGAYVDLDVGDSKEYEAYAKKCVEWMGWKFERQTGDRGLLTDLLAGRWDDERFLIVPPGCEIQHSADAGVMKAVPVSPSAGSL
ncbi:MAG: DUF1638 domain-containing protein [Methylacidiphilales bacterium]|nr:DUF1638 domain-containing protein [Candidatus Methylacidiphilales bacterium]